MPRVTFEFMVSSDLNLSNNASSTEIISGGICAVVFFAYWCSRIILIKIVASIIHVYGVVIAIDEETLFPQNLP